MPRAIVLFGILALSSWCALAADGPLHVTVDNGWARQPVVPNAVAQRIEGAASQYQQYAPIPRIALYDIAYPSSVQELQDLDGYVVILLSVFSQERRELPPARVFASFGGREYSLTLITSAVSSLPQSRVVTQVLGENRWDGLFLLPAYLIRENSNVSMDFAANRLGFVVQRFSTADPNHLPYVTAQAAPPRLKTPPMEFVMKFVAREYPGFVTTQ